MPAPVVEPTAEAPPAPAAPAPAPSPTPVDEFPFCHGELPAEAPPGASAAAVAYLQAVRAASPSWQAIDDRIVNNGLSVDTNDLIAQADADEPFILALEAIEFPEEATAAASDLIYALLDYREFLQATILDGFGTTYGEDTMRLQGMRSTASGALRTALGVPPSTCAYHRP